MVFFPIPFKPQKVTSWLKMRSVRKDEDEDDEEKNKEIILKLCSLIIRDWLARFFSNLICRFA